MAYLVDTDVLIDVAKGIEGSVGYLDSLDAPWSLSIITAMELLVGAKDKHDMERIDELTSTFHAVPLSAAAGTSAYRLVKQFAKSHGLRVFDALIAATAIEENRTLVTRNQKHFKMIPGLKLEVPQY